MAADVNPSSSTDPMAAPSRSRSPQKQTDQVAETSSQVAEALEVADAAEAQSQASDLSRAFAEDGMLKTHVGGQALIEGIMMRGKYNWSVAVRTPDGDIYVEEHDLASGKAKNGWMYWPLIRGCRAMVESLTLGFKALPHRYHHRA